MGTSLSSRPDLKIHSATFPSDGHFGGLAWPVFDLPNVRVEGRWMIPVLQDGTKLIEEALGPALAFTDLSKDTFSAPSSTELSGTYLSLAGRLDSNFYHWTSELLPNLILAELLNLTPKVILPPNVNEIPFIRDFLDILSIPESRIVEHPGADLELERYILPTRLHGMVVARSTSLLTTLRRRVLEALPPQTPPSRKVYVSRRAARARRVTNEDALREILSRYEFEFVSMDQLPLREQIILISNASCVVFPHGAALVHQLFLPKEAFSIELFSPYYLTTHSQYIAHKVGFRYFQSTVPISNFSPPVSTRNSASGLDIEANLDFVKITLDRELNRRSGSA